uniref:Uncharacterized protein n=1 Tax=Opuntia streptacantha TaxID=393608 RepID=A0A7C9AMV2_OPUST
MYHEMPDVRKCNLCTYAANISKLAFNSVLDLLTLFQRHVYELLALFGLDELVSYKLRGPKIFKACKPNRVHHYSYIVCPFIHLFKQHSGPCFINLNVRRGSKKSEALIGISVSFKFSFSFFFNLISHGCRRRTWERE